MGYFDDVMNHFSNRQTNFTAEEIEAAGKLSKKNGKTVLENLTEMTGRTIQANYDLNQQIAELNAQMLNDFGMNTEKIQEIQKEAYSPSGLELPKDGAFGNLAKASSEGPKEVPKDIDPETFEGVETNVEEIVFGQDAFIKQLVIAFKRPHVLPETEGHARNCFFVTGPEDTGRHLALTEVVKELQGRKILNHDSISTVDLSLYGSAGADNVFLQDLYTALQAPSDVILFENYEACHVSYLDYLSDLVIDGKCHLAERYILQKGQLVNVTNSFASEAVGSFSAAGKYLVFISTKGMNKLMDAFGAPFVNALGDVCTSKKLEDGDLQLVGLKEWKKLCDTDAEKLRLKLTAEPEDIRKAATAASSKGAGVTGILKLFSDLRKALATMILDGRLKKNDEVSLTEAEGSLMLKCGDLSVDLMSLLPESYSGELDEVRAELNNIVGLKEVKDYVNSLEGYYQVQKRRREAGLKASEVSKHMIFTGNPGTGKTTIARIISKYLKAIGVLSGGQLVEVTRADLVGRYVGHTAPLTNKVLQSAIGGVLFIDEAYSLYRGQDDTFGLEAIDTLVKGIEDNRDNLIVILAGYSNEMQEFLTSNSGLVSRFPNVIDFPDYTGQELLDIAKLTAKSKGYVIDEGAENALLMYFNQVQAVRAATAGNGRLVRNKIEDAILNQSRRLAAEPDAELSLLTSRDFSLDDING